MTLKLLLGMILFLFRRSIDLLSTFPSRMNLGNPAMGGSPGGDGPGGAILDKVSCLSELLLVVTYQVRISKGQWVR